MHAQLGVEIALSVSQSVSGHKNEHFEQIRNTCSWKNNNSHMPHKQQSYEELW